MQTKGLHHIHLVVRDLERSKRFYCSAFGMEEQFRSGEHMVFLSTPGSDDLVTLNADPAEREQAGAGGGIGHFGFRLAPGEDLGRAAEEVERFGGAVLSRGEHAPGVPYLYVRDPDGYVIEIGKSG